MVLFWRLILAHLLTDFPLQTNKIAEQKSKGIFWVIVHSLIFLMLGLILSYKFLEKIWVYIVIITCSHFLIDSIRIVGIRKYGMSDNVLSFLLDQLVHILIIFLFWKFLFISFSPVLEEKWTVILCLYIVATYFTSIFIYYIKNFDEVNIKGKEKYYGILERTYIFFCLLLPSFWGLVFPIVWLGRFILVKSKLKKEFDFSSKNLITGNIFAILMGITARVIYYY